MTLARIVFAIAFVLAGCALALLLTDCGGVTEQSPDALDGAALDGAQVDAPRALETSQDTVTNDAPDAEPCSTAYCYEAPFACRVLVPDAPAECCRIAAYADAGSCGGCPARESCQHAANAEWFCCA